MSSPKEDMQHTRENRLRTLFKARDNRPQLEVIRVREVCNKVEDEREVSVESEIISTLPQLKESSQVRCIQPKDPNMQEFIFTFV